MIQFNFFNCLTECFKPSLRLVPGVRDVKEQDNNTPRTKPTLYGRWHGRKLMTFSMTDSQQSTFTLQAVDKKGNPASLPAGSVQWLVDNPNLLTLTPAGDGLSCLVVAAGPLGVGTVSVKVTDGQDNTLAAGQIDVTITGGTAANIVVTPGTAVEQP